jgi:tetratricopeptide (TPR) repeat protein
MRDLHAQWSRAGWIEQARLAERQQAWARAALCWEQAAMESPADHRLHCNRGNALWLLGEAAEASAAFQTAIKHAPLAHLPYRGLGHALRDLNRFEEAACAYNTSLLIRDDPHTSWSLSQVLIGLQRFKEAFGIAEQRLAIPQTPLYRPGPYWQHWSESQEIWIWSEQGLGDSIQFVRWLSPLLAKPGLTIHLEVEEALVVLFRNGLKRWASRLHIQPKSDPRPVLESRTCQGSLLSLPHQLKNPAPAFDGAPYLLHPSWKQERRSHLTGPQVGITWASGRKLEQPFEAREYRRRSLPPAVLGMLLMGLHERDAQLCNLQIGADRCAAEPWRELFSQHLPKQADLAEQAQLMACLDLVISVDTATAHLLGATGLTGWILLPHSADPRWLASGHHSHWYESLRLFRQPRPGDWASVVDDVLQAFSRWKQA